jgi:hypothetical protein
MKPGMSALRDARLIDQVRKRIRNLHYSLGTEPVNVYWGRFFIRWAGHGGAMQHPRGMGDGNGNPPDARPAPHPANDPGFMAAKDHPTLATVPMDPKTTAPEPVAGGG